MKNIDDFYKENSSTIDWLFENAGPVIKFRTANELIGNSIDSETLIDEVLSLDKIQLLLDKAKTFTPERFTGRSLYNSIHGMGLTLEGVLYRLLSFGLRNGIGAFDEVMEDVSIYVKSRKVEEALKHLGDSSFGHGKEFCIANQIYMQLLMGGYYSLDTIKYIKYRINSIYDLAKDMGSDLYMHEKELANYPARSGKWVNKPVVKSEYWRNCFTNSVPSIHIILCIASFPKRYIDDTLKLKIDKIIEWILDDKFQALPENYGLVFSSKNKSYYSLGWRPDLPCKDGYEPQNDRRKIVFYMELMSKFKVARDSAWFNRSLNYLEQYKTSTGTYCFPNDHLSNIENSYYVNGTIMGLCENRRKKVSYELESTFRMLMIKKRISN